VPDKKLYRRKEFGIGNGPVAPTYLKRRGKGKNT